MMTHQETKKMNTLQRKRQQLSKLLLSTKVNTGEVMTYQEHCEYEGLYAALMAVVEQMNAIAEASCESTLKALRARAIQLRQA